MGSMTPGELIQDFLSCWDKHVSFLMAEEAAQKLPYVVYFNMCPLRLAVTPCPAVHLLTSRSCSPYSKCRDLRTIVRTRQMQYPCPLWHGGHVSAAPLPTFGSILPGARCWNSCTYSSNYLNKKSHQREHFPFSSLVVGNEMISASGPCSYK